jgi:hypothetical protein
MTVTSCSSGETCGYTLCGSNAGEMERSQQFFDKTDRGRIGATATPPKGAR